MTKVVTQDNYIPDDGHIPVGVSATVPRLSLPLAEMVKRFTIPMLEEMQTKSLLNYDFKVDPNASEEELLKLVDRVDLKSNMRDLTDLSEKVAFVKEQIEQGKQIRADLEAKNKELAARKAAEARRKLVEEAKAEIRKEMASK